MCWPGRWPLQPGADRTSVITVASPRPARPPRRAARSVAPVPLLAPRVAVHVIPVRLPESGLILVMESQSLDPLGALPKIEMGHQQPRRAAVFGLQRLPAVLVRHPRLAVTQGLERKVA